MCAIYVFVLYIINAYIQPTHIQYAMREIRKNISISEDTWERLKRFGIFGESFDDLLNRFMNIIEKEQEREQGKNSRKKLVEAIVIA